MATVGQIASTGYSSAATNAVNKEISDAKTEYSNLSKNKDLTYEELSKLQKEQKAKIAELEKKLSDAETDAISSIGSNTSNLLSGNTDTFSLFGNMSNSGQTGFDFFFGAKNTLASLSMVNSARQSIENRARTLSAEIKMDKMRGIDTSGKQEALSNLTSNVTLMNDNLTGNVNKALEKTKEDDSAPYKPIITKIKDQLTATQKELEKESKTMQEEANKKNGVSETEET